MGIGMTPNKEQKTESGNSEEFEFDDENLLNDDDDSKKQGSGGFSKNKKILLIILAVIVVFIFIAMALNGKSGETTENATQTDANSNIWSNEDATVSAETGNTDDVNTDYSTTDYSTTDNQPTQPASTAPNDIYDEDGNIISEDSTIIHPGDTDYKNNTNTSTDPRVYDSSDFIKDLNGVDISAVYNVASYDYVDEHVNYEKRRAVMADGMELYWLEVTYHEKPYRVTIPFWRYKAMEDSGICAVKMEVLTLEGGGKVVSYMYVQDEPSATE